MYNDLIYSSHCENNLRDLDSKGPEDSERTETNSFLGEDENPE